MGFSGRTSSIGKGGVVRVPGQILGSYDFGKFIDFTMDLLATKISVTLTPSPWDIHFNRIRFYQEIQGISTSCGIIVARCHSISIA